MRKILMILLVMTFLHQLWSQISEEVAVGNLFVKKTNKTITASTPFYDCQCPVGYRYPTLEELNLILSKASHLLKYNPRGGGKYLIGDWSENSFNQGDVFKVHKTAEMANYSPYYGKFVKFEFDAMHQTQVIMKNGPNFGRELTGWVMGYDANFICVRLATTAEIVKEKEKDVSTFSNMAKAFLEHTQKPCILFFYANWAAPCKKIMPMLNDIVTEYNGNIKVYNIDIDVEKELKESFGITIVPTLIFCSKEGNPKIVQNSLPYLELKQHVRTVFSLD